MSKGLLSLGFGFLFSLGLVAQTGPSGIFNNTDFDLLFQADRIGVSDGSSVNTLSDLSGGVSHDGLALPGEEPVLESDVANAINTYPVLKFDGTNDIVRLTTDAELNDSDFVEKTILISFQTSSDVISRQVIYEQGDLDDGLNVYIYNSRLYVGGYSDNAGSWSIYNDTIIEESTPYVVYLELNEAASTFTTYLDAVQFGTTAGADTLGASTGEIGLGNVNFNTQFHDIASATVYPFSGAIMDVISNNSLFNVTQRKILMSHFSAKYAIDLPTDFYDFHLTHGHHLIGIGAENLTGDSALKAQDTLAFLTLDTLNYAGLTAQDYIYIGADTGSITFLSSVETPYDSILRLQREWRVNLKGSVDSFRLTIDTNIFPAGARPGYNKFAILVDDDGDFSSGALAYEMYSPGSNEFYVADSLQWVDGQYFTFAKVFPKISFTAENYNDFEAVSPARFPLEQNIILKSDLSVSYNATDVTATQSPTVGFDYDNFSGMVIIPSGAYTDTIDVTIVSDATIEPEETFDLKLSGLAASGFDSARYTINGDDNPTKVLFAWLDSVNVESEDTIYAEVQLSAASASVVTIDYEVTGGSATGSGVDYNIMGSTLTFAPGDTRDTILIEVNDDNLHEVNEEIDFRLLNVVNANLDDDSTIAKYTIQDDDQPTLSFVDSTASQLENSGFVFLNVVLDTLPDVIVTVDYLIQTGSATSGDDYADTSGTLTFLPGDTIETIVVRLKDDADLETVENFYVQIQNAVAAIISNRDSVEFSILDDEGLGHEGPGGVALVDDQLALWLRTTAPGTMVDLMPVANWEDQSVKLPGNVSNDAIPEANAPDFFDNASTNWNGRGVISFDQGNSEGLALANDNNLNTAASVSRRTLTVAFRTSNDITNRQVLYEEGAGVRGISIYIESDTCYIGAWNDANDAGPGTAWEYIPARQKIEKNTPYFAMLQLDVPADGVRGFLNGVDLGTQPGALSALYNHPGANGIGYQNGGACYISTTDFKSQDCDGGDDNYFEGFIAEVVSGQIVYNDAQLIIVNNYFSTKYDLTIPVADDKYAFDATHSWELFGIGQEDASNNHIDAQGSGAVRINTPSDINNSEYLLIGHDNDTIDTWTTTEVLDDDTANIKRTRREWRVDKTGDLGSITLQLDTSVLGDLPAGFTNYAIMVDADGDFTSGADIYPLSSDGSGLMQITNLDFNDGDYFSFAAIRTSIEFVNNFADYDEDAGTVSIKVRRNIRLNSSSTIDYFTLDGTADDDQLPLGDYDSLGTTLTIPAGDTVATISLIINDDTDIESDEDLTINLQNPIAGAVIGQDTVFTVLIHDNDNTRIIEFTADSLSADESSSLSAGALKLRLNERDAVNPTRVVYTVSIASSTADSNIVNDFALALYSDTLTIAPTDSLVDFPAITINDDAIDENDEVIIITLSSPINANLGDTTTFVYTINDNDAEPVISFDLDSSEGFESVSPALLTVRLSSVSGKTVTVDFDDTGLGDAIGGGSDYSLTNGVLTFLPGQDSLTIPITVFDDLSEELDKTVIIGLSNSSNATIDAALDTIVYTIVDDDGLGIIGPGGVGNFDDQVDVWLRTTDAPGLSDGVSIGAKNGPTDWEDQTGHDIHAYQNTIGQEPEYFDISPTLNNRPVVTFDAGTNEFLRIDNDPRLNTASGPQNKRTLMIAFRTSTDINTRQVLYEEGAGARGLNFYIENDTLYAGGWNLPDDDGPGTGWTYRAARQKIDPNTPYFTVLEFDFTEAGVGSILGSLNGDTTEMGSIAGAGRLFPHGGAIGLGAINAGTCIYGSCPGSGANFTGYLTEFVSGSYVYNDAQRKIVANYFASKYNTSLPAGDTLYNYRATHSYEVFGIGRYNSTNAHYEAQGHGIVKVDEPTIISNDGSYTLYGHDGAEISSWVTSEIPTGSSNFQRLEREWKVSHTSGGMGNVDIHVDTTRLPVKPFAYTKYLLLVDADGDFSSGAEIYEMTYDNFEFYTVEDVALPEGYHYTFATARPTIDFEQVTSSGAETATPAQFKVKLSYVSAVDVIVNLNSSDGTADDDQLPTGDYDSLATTVTILAGSDSAIVDLVVNNDVVTEADETVNVRITGVPSGYVIGDDSIHVYTIQDDDNPRKIEFTATSSAADESSSVSSGDIQVEINLADGSNPTTVDYTIDFISSTADSNIVNDYAMASYTGTLTIAAGATTANFPAITINDDASDEPAETIVITLSNPTNANLGTDVTYTYTINDNDAEPTVEFEVVTQSGSESFDPALLKVKLSAPSGNIVSVNYSATDGTAVGAGFDYNLFSGTLNIPAGDDSAFIEVLIANDLGEEATEDFTVTIASPVNATLGPNTTLTYSILDDDGLGIYGPGGVGEDGQYVQWLRSDAESYADGAAVNTFNDQTLFGYDLTAGTAPDFRNNVTDNINGRPVVEFNGTNDYLSDNSNINDLFRANVSYTKKTFLIAFETGASTTGKQVLMEMGDHSRGVNLYIDDGDLYFAAEKSNGAGADWPVQFIDTAIAANTVYYLLAEFDSDNDTMSMYLNGSLVDSDVASFTNSLQGDGDQMGLGAAFDRATFHDLNYTTNGGNNYRFEGKIMEMTHYNFTLNNSQKRIVENYFAAKYQNEIEATIPDDKYAYQGTYNYDFIGIGQENSADNHTASQGYGMIRVDQPSGLSDGEYLMMAHDNGSIATWAFVDQPFDSINHVSRIWRVSEPSGDVGEVRIAVDTTGLPARPTSSYTSYVLLVETNDGDFSNGDVDIYPLSVASGELKMTDPAYAIDFNDGDYFTIGIARNRSVNNGDWNTPSTWLAGTVPTSSENALITPGDTVNITSNVSVGGIILEGVGSSVRISGSQTVEINNGTISNNAGGEFLAGSSTIDFTSDGAQCIPGASENITYYALRTSGSGTKTLCDNITVTDDLTIFDNSTLDVDNTNDFTINLAGDFNVSAAATFNAHQGEVIFDGASVQTITALSGSESFYDFTVSNTSGGVRTFNTDLDVNNDLVINASGVLNMSYSSDDLSIAGDFTNNNGTSGFNAGSSTETVAFDGTSNQLITSTAAKQNFNHVNVNTSGQLRVDASTDLDFNGDLTIASGSILDVNTNSNDVCIAGDWTNNNGASGFNQGTNTVIFDGNQTQTIYSSSGSESFYTLNISNTAPGVVNTNSTDLFVLDDFTISASGVLDVDAGDADFTLYGDWTNNNGLAGFVEGCDSERITFRGGVTQTVVSAASTEGFNNVLITASSTLVSDATTDFDLCGDLTIDFGSSLDASVGTTDLFVGGNWTNNAAASGFIQSTVTVTFDGTDADQTINYSETFHNLIINNSGSNNVLTTLNRDITVVNDFIIQSGAIFNADLGNTDMIVGGDWTNNHGDAGFVQGAQSETVTFNGTTDQLVTSVDTREYFNRLTISNSGGAQFRADATTDIDASDRFTISAGAIVDAETNDNNYYLFHIWVNNAGDAGFIEGTDNETVTFDGALVNQSITTVDATEVFNNLTIANSLSRYAFPAGAANLDINGNLLINNGSRISMFNKDFTLAGNWTNNGGANGYLQGTETTTFDGATDQTISSTTEEIFRDIVFAKTGGNIILAADIATLDQITFSNDAYVIMNTNDVRIDNWQNGDIVGYNTSTRFFVSDADAYLKTTAVDAGETFNVPIGIATGATNYAGADIKHISGAATTFDVSLCDYVSDMGGCSGGTEFTTNIVDYYWDVISSSTDAGVTLHWDQSKEMAGFDRTDMEMSRYDAPGPWEWVSWPIVNGVANNVSGTLWNYTDTLDHFTGLALGNSSGPLPVELISFQATKTPERHVELTWKTASEINNDYFVIEKSTDAVHYIPLQEVEGAGNSNVELSYVVLDQSPYAGVSYYRLKQVDYDGTVSYKGVREVNFNYDNVLEKKNPEFTMYPNPTNGDFFTIQTTSPYDALKEVFVVVSDVNGREFYSKVVVTDESGNFTTVVDPYDRIPAGIYVVMASKEGQIYSDILIVE